MKKTNLFRMLLLAAAAVLGLTLASCNDEPQGEEGDKDNVVLTTQAEVDAFKPQKQISSLKVTGTDITDISNISVTTVGTLTIDNTGIISLENENIASVNTKLEIINNAELCSIEKLGLKFCTGDIVIKNNPKLECIKGLLSLKKMSGNLIITDNAVLGKDDATQGDEYGFNVVKKLIDDQVIPAANVTLSNNHPEAATDPSLIGAGEGGVASYTIRNLGDIASVKSRVVNNLSILGEGIDNDVWALIGAAIDEVQGDLLVEGCKMTTTENFFEKVQCNGSITLKDLTNHEGEIGVQPFFNTNGLKNYTEIKGDLKLINVPYLIHWGSGNSLAQIKKIGGDLYVEGCGMQELAFLSLEEVGGNFTITNCDIALYTGMFWNLKTNLKKVGGNFTYTNNAHVNSLHGFEYLREVGGDLLISGNGSAEDAGDISSETSGSGFPGWNLVAAFKKYNCVKGKIECFLSDRVTPVNFDDITPVVFEDMEAPKLDYVIKSQADIDAIALDGTEKRIAKSLTVTGTGVTDDVWSKIKTKIKTVEGDVTVDGCLVTNSTNFFADVECLGNITLKNLCTGSGQFFNSDDFPTHILGNLTIENVNIHGWPGAGFNMVEEIDGDLNVKTTMMGNNAAFCKLKKVGGNVTIDGVQKNFNGERVWNLSEWTIETIVGKLTIQNTQFVNFAGFQYLKNLGSLYVKNNPIETADFSQVQTWIDNIVVSKSNVECYDANGNKVEFKDPLVNDGNYIITSQADIDALTLENGQKIVAKSLTVKGSGVTDNVWANIKTKISKVTGTLTAENCSFTMCSNFFKGPTSSEGVECEGSIIFRNICSGAGQFLNSDNFPTHVKGDLILDNVNIHGWAGAGFNMVSDIDGDLYIKTATMGNNAAFCLLKTVGGNVTIDGVQKDFNGNRVWNVDQWTIQSIGGKLTIQNTMFVNFAGFGGLTKVGGLYVKGNPIPNADFSQVQTWISNRAVPFASVECYDENGTKVSFTKPAGDYYISSQADIDAIQGEGITAQNLYVLGSGVDDTVWANIKTKISKVTGTLTAEDCAFTMAGNLFSGVDCQGSIIFRNICTGAGQFLNSDNVPTHVKGDLILDNVRIHGWPGAGFNMITAIDGDLYVKTSVMGNNAAFCQLKTVGGNVTIDGPQVDFNNNRVWNVSEWTIQSIGGKLTIQNTQFVNFAGFGGLTKLGSLLVKNNPIPTDTFSQVQTWITGGVVSKSKVECYDENGNAVSFK